MESYSPSIQQICVFQKSQSEISNNGISYLNNFLVDLTNAIIIDSIQNCNQSYHKSIQIDDIERTVHKIFPDDIAYHIIGQSKSRIQLGAENSSSNAGGSTSPSLTTSGGEEDEDGFEIIPREDKSTEQQSSLGANPMSGSLFSPTSSVVSSSFPIELVHQVSIDLIKRKKLIHQDTSFYHILETQPSHSSIFIFISYSMETITTRILKKIFSPVITEDEIRKTIQEDQVLNQVRHTILQVTNIANKILNGESVKEFNSTLSMSTSISNMNTSFTGSTTSLLQLLDDDLKKEKLEVIEKPKEMEESVVNETTTTVPITTTSSPSQEVAITSATTTITPPEEKAEETKTDDNKIFVDKINNSDIFKNNDTIVNNNKNINNKILTPTINNNNNDNNTKTPTITKQSIKQRKSPSKSSSSSKTTESIITQTIKVPFLFDITEPVDLFEILLNFEIKNGLFLILLILIGLVIQSFNCNSVY